MVSLHAGRFAVVHLYSSFSVDPHNFPLGTNLYQKLPFLAILAAVRPHFKSHNGESWRDRGYLGDLPRAKFCKKNCLRRYTPFVANIYQKLPIFGALSPHF